MIVLINNNMTNLKIGTILIAKEDKFMFANDKQFLTKDKGYVIDKIQGQYITIKSDLYDEHIFKDTKIDEYFTIKRYTLSDLRERKIAVKLKNYEEYKRLCEAVGDIVISEDTYCSEKTYYGIDDNPSSIVFMFNENLQGRTLLDSIDEIDLGDEGKEERKPINEVAELIGEASMCWSQTPKGIFDSRRASKIVDKIDAIYESEIARLKGEVDKWREESALWNTRYHHILSKLTEKTNDLNQLRESPQISQDLTKRERMAWEIYIRNNMSFESAFKMVDEFLAKSKEVENG